VRREIRGGVVDIMQLSFAKRGENWADLSVEPEPELSHSEARLGHTS
jgi:hypothetical protein